MNSARIIGREKLLETIQSPEISPIVDTIIKKVGIGILNLLEKQNVSEKDLIIFLKEHKLRKILSGDRFDLLKEKFEQAFTDSELTNDSSRITPEQIRALAQVFNEKLTDEKYERLHKRIKKGLGIIKSGSETQEPCVAEVYMLGIILVLFREKNYFCWADIPENLRKIVSSKCKYPASRVFQDMWYPNRILNSLATKGRTAIYNFQPDILAIIQSL